MDMYPSVVMQALGGARFQIIPIGHGGVNPKRIRKILHGGQKQAVRLMDMLHTHRITQAEVISPSARCSGVTVVGVPVRFQSHDLMAIFTRNILPSH